MPARVVKWQPNFLKRPQLQGVDLLPIVEQSGPPADTTVLWLDPDDPGSLAPTKGSGTTAERVAAAATASEGDEWDTTDEFTSTPYVFRAGLWVQRAAGVTQYGGRLLDRKENLTDVTCTSTSVPVDIPNLSSTVTKVAGRSLTVVWGGRLYHTVAAASALLFLYVDGVFEEDLQHNTAVNNHIGEIERAVVFDALTAGPHTFKVALGSLTTASTSHAWGAVKSASRGNHRTYLSVYES